MNAKCNKLKIYFFFFKHKFSNQFRLNLKIKTNINQVKNDVQLNLKSQTLNGI